MWPLQAKWLQVLVWPWCRGMPTLRVCPPTVVFSRTLHISGPRALYYLCDTLGEQVYHYSEKLTYTAPPLASASVSIASNDLKDQAPILSAEGRNNHTRAPSSHSSESTSSLVSDSDDHVIAGERRRVPPSYASKSTFLFPNQQPEPDQVLDPDTIVLSRESTRPPTIIPNPSDIKRKRNQQQVVCENGRRKKLKVCDFGAFFGPVLMI